MLWQGKKERKKCKVTGNHEFKETVNKVVSEVSSFVGNPEEQESPPGEGGGGGATEYNENEENVNFLGRGVFTLAIPLPEIYFRGVYRAVMRHDSEILNT